MKFILLFLFLCLFLSIVPCSSSSLASSYIILIDLGSSGSRIHIHRYNLPAVTSYSPSLPVISPSISKKVKPGLASFDSPASASSSLIPLLDFAVSNIPSALHATVPLYVWATAGLRALPLSHSSVLLDSIYLLCQNYPFHLTRRQVKIISGIDEGIYGWIATNYLMNKLNGADSLSSSIGVLEMGGASFQITFSPRSSSLSSFHPGQLWNLPLAGHKYLIFTASYLNFGLEEAQRLHWKKMLQKKKYQNTKENQEKKQEEEEQELIQDPCRPIGLNREIKPFPPVIQSIPDPSVSELPFSSLLMPGSGNYTECVHLVDELITQKSFESIEQLQEEREFQQFQSLFEHSDIAEPLDYFDRIQLQRACYQSSNHYSSPYPCGFGGLPLPLITPNDHFLAIENFYYTSEFFNLLVHSHPPNGLTQAGIQFCKESWENLQLLYPNEPRDDLEKYCFSSAYLRRVLEKGLGFQTIEKNIKQCKWRKQNEKNEQDSLQCEHYDSYIDKTGDSELSFSVYKNIRFTKFINGVQLDWALGAVLKLITDQDRKNAPHDDSKPNADPIPPPSALIPHDLEL
jgi:hypothetical protein